MSIGDDDIQSWYTCGNCRMAIYYLTSDGPPDTCTECGYAHKERSVSDVPSEIKLDLNQY